MNPFKTIFNRSGFVLEADVLRVMQKDGWVDLPLGEVAEIKKPSFGVALVRLTDGRTRTLDLSHLSVAAFHEIMTALHGAVHEHRIVASSTGAPLGSA